MASAALTLLAIASIVGHREVATPWIVCAVLACLALAFFVAYVRAASQRDAASSVVDDRDALRRRITALEATEIQVIDQGDGTSRITWEPEPPAS